MKVFSDNHVHKEDLDKLQLDVKKMSNEVSLMSKLYNDAVHKLDFYMLVSISSGLFSLATFAFILFYIIHK